MSGLWVVVHFRPFLSGKVFTLGAGYSAPLWSFDSRDLDPKLYRCSLRLAEFDMVKKWRAGTYHELPDVLSRLLRPGSAGDLTDYSFPNDAPSGYYPTTSAPGARS